MPLGTLDRTPPPFFKQGPSALSKLVVFGALALFLMVADSRLHISQPLRLALSTVIYPVQWLAMQPGRWATALGAYTTTMADAERTKVAASQKLAAQTQRAQQTEQLVLENERLRQLLTLRPRLQTSGIAAEVLYDAADPYTRKVVVDRGLVHGVALGSPVVDELGVLGQITRVQPATSEVTLLTDRDYAVPVLNTRSGARSVAYGDPVVLGGALELRFMPANADVQVGDLLTTSGVDGIYPPGLHVAKVTRIEPRNESAFARIYCIPLAQMHGTKQVLLLKPITLEVSNPLPAASAPASAAASARRKASS